MPWPEEKRKINPSIDPNSLTGLVDVVPASIHPPLPHHFYPCSGHLITFFPPTSLPLHVLSPLQGCLSHLPFLFWSTPTCHSAPSSYVTFCRKRGPSGKGSLPTCSQKPMLALSEHSSHQVGIICLGLYMRHGVAGMVCYHCRPSKSTPSRTKQV